ncbi:hypothetical protein [Herbinix luporum]|jgi:hypothetical protein|uniref:hypothetical protein n=1 Tax=Herbinix luporum TaxID=1679721 RepID=UPI00175ECC10|nr:hypothetical protein [Herbinix luporum]HHT57927.1 hypothetical protein [Herbinix luporum]
MKFFRLLERKLSKYAIPNLMKYVVSLYVVGAIIYTFYPFAYMYLGLEVDQVLKGQVWRLVTFLIPVGTIGSFTDVLFLIIRMYVFYLIGNSLESVWGSFRLNLYFFSAVFFNIIAAFIVYGIYRVNILGDFMLLLSSMFISPPLDIIYSSMFFAYAAIYPNTQFLLYFIIPLKAKYFAWISGAIYLKDIYNLIVNKFYLGIIPIVVSLANFFIFFLCTRDYQRISPREFERKARFRRQMKEGMKSGNVVEFRGKTVITRHKCAVCGRTELDNDDLEFRFCSKCEGNYEYCMDHLYTHEHVKNN